MSALLREVDSNARGVMAEEMILGAVEAYVGCTRDPKLGLVVAVGSGGIDLELVRDVVVLVAPFTRMEAMAKLQNTHLWRVLTGFRGRHFDAEGLLDAVELIGRLGISLPGLVSLEVNPLFVTGRGVFAGDAKLVIG
jgi:acetyl-CoA synthetase (ADP-forming)